MSPESFAKPMLDSYEKAPKVLKITEIRRPTLASFILVYRLIGSVAILFSIISVYGALFSHY